LWNEAFLTTNYEQNMFPSTQIKVVSRPKKPRPNSDTKVRVQVQAQKVPVQVQGQNAASKSRTKKPRPITGPETRVQALAQKPRPSQVKSFILPLREKHVLRKKKEVTNASPHILAVRKAVFINSYLLDY
jgi:hypothetical protein